MPQNIQQWNFCSSRNHNRGRTKNGTSILLLIRISIVLQKSQNKDDLYQGNLVKKRSFLNLERLLSNSEPTIARNSGLPLMPGNTNNIEMIDRSKEKDRIEIKKKGQRTSIATSIDFVSRFLFPCAFISFNIFYWYHYLNAA